MSRFLKAAVLAAASLFTLSAVTEAGQFDLGREALPEEVAAWDIDVRPDGQGLPEGSGTVEEGEQLFTDNCAACHGDFGEGIDRWPVLAGGQDTLAGQNPVKTVGSYWPYLSTVYDYINRAMPFGYAQSLEPDQVYAITAYILYLNDLMGYEDSLSKQSFTTVVMPNEENFFDDPRPDVPGLAQGEPCMSDCKESVEILNRARILDVTPEEGEGAGQVD